ncbi:protein kinase domain-containing protein [Actinomyces howellii]|uniref:non-specific serine/threonine protein kinase n=1 Tax=Actinomyces howellii TaxID=52771 RepID=A0A3S4QZ91_9ACTO|nr:protein kinase [Actinomyces howellii]VEG25836.1 Serine/threonine-protein kinase PrkC [Actinomyces howellii]
MRITALLSRPSGDDDPDPDPLGEDPAQVLAAAGVCLGGPMGRDRPGHLAPRRGLDSHGRDVVVHLVDLPEGAEGARTLRRLADLRARRHPGLAPVRDVIALPQRRAAVTVDLVAGADLAVVLGARGGLTRGETSRLLEDVGGALAHLHECGLTHGDVSPANVVVSCDGGAVLIDILSGALERGTDGCSAPERDRGSPATAASDVYSLAALLRTCTAGTTTLAARVDRVVADALEADPRARPTARDLTARVPELGRPGVIELPDGARLAAGALRAAAARPTRLVSSRRNTAPGASGEASRGTARRTVTGVAALVLAGAMAVAVVRPPVTEPARIPPAAGSRATATGTPWAAATTEPGAGGGVTVGGEPDLVTVVVELAAARDAALGEADGQALAATTVPGSPAALADQEVVAALEAAGERVEGLQTHVASVEQVEVPAADAARWPGATAVQVTQSQAASTRVSGDGGRRTVPARPARQIVLVLVPGPWRVAAVHEAR